MHSQGQVSANPDGDIIVVTDFAQNLRKARAIVSAMGEGGNVRETVQLTQLSVLDAEDALKQLGGTKAAYKVVALEATNSLILEGSPQDVAELRRLLQSMDVGSSVPRGAVSVVPLRFADGEGLNELIQQLLPSYIIEGQPEPTVAYESGSNTLRNAGNLLSVIGAIGADDVGLSAGSQTDFQDAAIASLAGIDGGAFGVGGSSNDALFGLIINALQTDDDSNTITTGSSVSQDTLNVFTTTERQEVGIQLDVLPQISDGDVIRLEIEQIVSSIAGVLTDATGDFILNKREITTTVLANDGEIIVLGGLVHWATFLSRVSCFNPRAHHGIRRILWFLSVPRLSETSGMHED